MDLAEEPGRKWLGVEVRNHWMETCLFANDLVLIAKSSRELQERLDTLANFAEAWKMKFNPKKSDVVVVGENSKLQKTGLWKLRKEKIGEIMSASMWRY